MDTAGRHAPIDAVSKFNAVHDDKFVRSTREEFRAARSKFSGKAAKEKQLNTYFVVGGHSFDSREGAVNQLARFKKKETFAIQEIEQTKVTRRSAAGNVLTEIVKGSLEKVPRIISTEKLSPLFYVYTVGSPFDPRWAHRGEFSTSEEADRKRGEEQAQADARALLTEADIKEVHVSTLADIFERDDAKIDELGGRVFKANQSVIALLKQTNTPMQTAAELENQICALQNVLGNLQIQMVARTRFEEVHKGELEELKLAKQASKAYYDSIHWDKFADQAHEKLVEDHRCWPDDACREGGECTYEPDEDEIEEYVFDNADDFELDLDPDSEEAKALLEQAAKA